jgi:hypothetical protein
MYHLTAAGARHWAEIGVSALGRQKEDTKPARMLRAIANGKLNIRCEVPGCERPRKINQKGQPLPMCEEHLS